MNNTVLDLFCGRGGWSKGFSRVGFDVLGVDIKNYDYPFDLILQDVRTLEPSRFDRFDVIVGSPPCRDFTIATNFHKCRPWKDPPNPERGLELVHCFLDFVRDTRPRFWVMENVPQLQNYLKAKPVLDGVYFARTMRRSLWGWFPSFEVKTLKSRLPTYKIKRNRPSVRAEIPFRIAWSLARVCRDT